jgi:gamma-glutamylputrescine oxidase
MRGHIDTYYARTLEGASDRPEFEGHQRAETCVIGGGLAGIATALDLAERGRSVILLESRKIGWGASGRAGGFVSQGFHTGAQILLSKLGREHAKELFDLSKLGHRLVRERIASYDIDCGPNIFGALTCTLSDMHGELEAYRDLMAENFGVELEYWPSTRLRNALAAPRYHKALFSPDTFSVNPLRLTQGLAHAAEKAGARLFEGSPAIDVSSAGGLLKIRTAKGEIEADNVVIACGGYIDGLSRPLMNATIPVSSYVMVTEPAPELLARAISVPYAIYDLQYLPNYYRKLDDGRLLWGGRAAGWEPSPKHLARILENDMRALYPDLKRLHAEVAWSGLMSYLTHEMPTLGPLAPRIWFATGFGGLGLATTSMAGRLIASAIVDGDDRWRLFEKFGLPYAGGRSIARVASQLAIWFAVAAERMGKRIPVS